MSNDKVFTHFKTLGFVLPDFWFAYPVNHKQGLIPFDDPLTFQISDDFIKVTFTVIHELCHVFFSYYENSELCNKLWQDINSKHEGEDDDTKKHLIVIPLAITCLEKLYSKEIVTKYLDLEKQYEGLERSWEILDSIKMKKLGN